MKLLYGRSRSKQQTPHDDHRTRGDDPGFHFLTPMCLRISPSHAPAIEVMDTLRLLASFNIPMEYLKSCCRYGRSQGRGAYSVLTPRFETREMVMGFAFQTPVSSNLAKEYISVFDATLIHYSVQVMGTVRELLPSPHLGYRPPCDEHDPLLFGHRIYPRPRPPLMILSDIYVRSTE